MAELGDRVTDPPAAKAERFIAETRARYPSIDAYDVLFLATLGLFEIDASNHKRIRELERRLAELEQRRTMAYRGIWSADEQYAEGDYTTDAGSLWHCNAALTGSRPGRDTDWQLVCKRGKAG